MLEKVNRRFGSRISAISQKEDHKVKDEINSGVSLHTGKFAGKILGVISHDPQWQTWMPRLSSQLSWEHDPYKTQNPHSSKSAKMENEKGEIVDLYVHLLCSKSCQRMPQCHLIQPFSLFTSCASFDFELINKLKLTSPLFICFSKQLRPSQMQRHQPHH